MSIIAPSSYPSKEIALGATIVIEGSVVNAIRSGYVLGPGFNALTIVDGKWRRRTGRALCPIGALLVDRSTKQRVSNLQAYFDDAARILKVSTSWIDEFLCGFDDAEEPCGLHDDAWLLGASYRARFVEAIGGTDEN